MEDALERVTLRKVTRRLIPFMFTLYVFNYLDRGNVSMAGLTFKHDLRLSDFSFGIGMGIFFIGYFTFQVPSNLIMNRVGARRWITCIIVTWGVIASLMMFVKNVRQFEVLRFFLGVAEAGFFPGMVLYLSYWFPASARARASAKFMIAGAISGILGGPLGGRLLGMNGVVGLRGWQWLFLVEGVPSIILGITTLFYLTDRPEDARWLSDEERTWLVRRMNAEDAQRRERNDYTLGQALRSEKVVRLASLFLLLQICGYGVGLWTPLLLKARAAGMWSDQHIGNMLALPGLLGIAAALLSAAHSDRTHERRRHMVVGTLINALGIALVAIAPNAEMTLLALTLSGIGGAIANGPFWAVTSTFLSGAAAAGGIAFINGFGNLGGFVGPTVMGAMLQRTGSYQAGILCLSATLVVAAWMASQIRPDPADDHPDPKVVLPDETPDPSVLRVAQPNG